MKCLACGKEIDVTKNSRCPVCGLELVSFAADGEDLDRLIGEEKACAKAYYDNLIGGIRVAVPLYDYSKEKETAGIEYFNMKNLEPGTVYWFPEAFARLKRGIELVIRITDSKGHLKDEKIKLKDPGCTGDFQQLGLLLKEGFVFQVLTGTEQKYSSSREISLLIG